MMKMKIIKVWLAPAVLFAVVLSCSKSKINKEEPAPTDPYATFFKGEVKPATTKPCFNGAYYYKVVSSTDYWLGMKAKIKLPTMTFDPARTNPAKAGQYLDNPSIYMGGNMGGQETDIGLTWEVIRDAGGNISPDRRAFRPFLRRTAYQSQLAAYENAPATADYYWYPGEEVTISVQVIEPKKIKFIVEGAGKRFESDFASDGYYPNNLGEFKRVNAIDQVSNEGKPVQATKTRVEGAVWSETYLFRTYEGKVVQVPLHSGRYTDMRCPAKTNFNITSSAEQLKIGAGTVNISGEGY